MPPPGKAQEAWFCFAPEFNGLRHRIRRHFHVPQGSSDLIRASLDIISHGAKPLHCHPARSRRISCSGLPARFCDCAQNDGSRGFRSAFFILRFSRPDSRCTRSGRLSLRVSGPAGVPPVRYKAATDLRRYGNRSRRRVLQSTKRRGHRQVRRAGGPKSVRYKSLRRRKCCRVSARIRRAESADFAGHCLSRPD